MFLQAPLAELKDATDMGGTDLARSYLANGFLYQPGNPPGFVLDNASHKCFPMVQKDLHGPVGRRVHRASDSMERPRV